MPTKPKLKVAYSDFWADFDPEKNFFADVLRSRFELETSSTPDVLICSAFGQEWRAFSCPRILFTGENLAPDRRFFDASLSFEPSNETNYYLPLYRLYSSYPLSFRQRTIDEATWARRKKIGIVFSNAQSRFRTRAFHRLNQSFGVDSGGRAFNNVGGPVADKGLFLSGYRFSFAFENTRWSGYTTEKLLEAYGFGTVPLYWGDPQVGKVFNPRSFLRLDGSGDFPRFEKNLRGLLDDFTLYREVFEEPLFRGNQEPEFLRKEVIADFLEASIAQGLRRRWQKKVTDYQAYAWGDLWKYREWDQSLAPAISFLKLFTWVGFIVLQIKKTAKRFLRRSQ